MTPIKDIEGIGPVYAEKLGGAGVKTTAGLLKVAASKAGRQSLAESTDISETLILEWVNLADLFRIKGVGEEYSDLLEEAGVDSVPELAQRNAANLHKAILETNEAKKLVRRVPTLNQVTSWVDQAKTMDRVVTH